MRREKDFTQAYEQSEWERDYLPSLLKQGSSLVSEKFSRYEDSAYRLDKPNYAMELAILAVESAQRREFLKRLIRIVRKKMEFPEIPKNKSNSIYFRLEKDGDEVTAVFRGNPIVYSEHWIEPKDSGPDFPKGRSEICLGEGCLLCKNNNIPRHRCRVNAFIEEDGKWALKVFQGPASILSSLNDMQKKGYKIEETKITVSRMKDKKLTKYTVMAIPGPKAYLTQDMSNKLSQIPLNSLSASFESNTTQESNTDSDIPF